MTIIVLEKKTNELRNVTEVFGLPKAGKTTLTKRLERRKEVLNWKGVGGNRKLYYFLKYVFLHPLSSSYLFYKLNSHKIKMDHLGGKEYSLIWRMRNSYLSSTLAKYEYLKWHKGIIVDEFALQSMFMILQKKSDKKELWNVMGCLPDSGKILLVETNDKERYGRLSKIKKFSRDLDKEWKMKWWKTIEHNYKIMKEILKERYKVAT